MQPPDGPPPPDAATCWRRWIDPRRSTLAPAVFIAWIVVLAWIPSCVIGHVVVALYPGPALQFDGITTWAEFAFLALLVAPVLETQIMRGVFALMRRSPRLTPHASAIIALLATAAHLPSPSWGLHATWSFWIMGRSFEALQDRYNRRAAIWGVTLIHALFNTLSLIGEPLARHLGSGA